jgi:hypothetical protein
MWLEVLGTYVVQGERVIYPAERVVSKDILGEKN